MPDQFKSQFYNVDFILGMAPFKLMYINPTYKPTLTFQKCFEHFVNRCVKMYSKPSEGLNNKIQKV